MNRHRTALLVLAIVLELTGIVLMVTGERSAAGIGVLVVGLAVLVLAMTVGRGRGGAG